MEKKSNDGRDTGDNLKGKGIPNIKNPNWFWQNPFGQCPNEQAFSYGGASLTLLDLFSANIPIRAKCKIDYVTFFLLDTLPYCASVSRLKLEDAKIGPDPPVILMGKTPREYIFFPQHLGFEISPATEYIRESKPLNISKL